MLVSKFIPTILSSFLDDTDVLMILLDINL